MSAEDIGTAIDRVDGALLNGGRISMITAEGNGRSNRDVPVTLTHEQSAPIFQALREVLCTIKS